MLILKIATIALAALLTIAYKPVFGQFLSNAEVYARFEESQINLRKAMLALREARVNSCRLSNNLDCDLVKLSDLEITLFDFELKYQRLSRSGRMQEEVEKYKKLKNLAGEARQSVSELTSKVDEATK